MSANDRFEPHAARAMASMFDDVSGRYDLLNRLMTLGQDRAWREAMWRRVPEDAHVVLDLCTGSGVSLPGLRRPGRVVLGVDVSLAMLEVAEERHGGPGWSPRLACADAFRLPLRAASLDAVTVAFGVRNLRPRATAMAELARVVKPGGVLVVLEAAAPAPGPLAPFHAFWVRRMIPLLGGLSPDPSAYRYLSESIFEFGAGPEFERDLEGAGFAVEARSAFLLGATRLWTARRAGSLPVGAVRNASPSPREDGAARAARLANHAQARAWLATSAVISAALTLVLAWGLVVWIKTNAGLPLTAPERALGWVLLAGGLVVFGARSLYYALRYAAESSGR